MEKKRLVGLTIIALIEFIIGILLLIYTIFNIVSTINTFQELESGMILWSIEYSGLCIAISVILVWLGLSILKLKKGSRQSSRIFAALCIWLISSYHPFGLVFEVLRYYLWFGLFFIFVWMIVYLSLPKVKEQFK